MEVEAGPAGAAHDASSSSSSRSGKSDSLMDPGLRSTGSPISSTLVSDMNEKKVRDLLTDQCREYVTLHLDNDKFRDLLDQRMQPLLMQMRKIGDENRRLKISLNFFESELKDAKDRIAGKKRSNTRDIGIQVHESDFLRDEDDDQQRQPSNRSVVRRLLNGHTDQAGLKRLLDTDNSSSPSSSKRPSTSQSPAVPHSTATPGTSGYSVETRNKAVKSTSSTATRLQPSHQQQLLVQRQQQQQLQLQQKQKQLQQNQQSQSQLLTRSAAAAAAATNTPAARVPISRHTIAPKSTITQTISFNNLPNGLQPGQYLIFSPNNVSATGTTMTTVAGAANATTGLILRPAPPAAGLNGQILRTATAAAAAAPAAPANQQVVGSINKTMFQQFVNLKRQQEQQQQQQLKDRQNASSGNSSNLSPQTQANLLAMITNNPRAGGAPSGGLILTNGHQQQHQHQHQHQPSQQQVTQSKSSTGSSVTLSLAVNNRTYGQQQQQKSSSSGPTDVSKQSSLTISQVPSPSGGTTSSSQSWSKDGLTADEDDEMDVEVVPVPKPPTPDVVDLSDDEDGETVSGSTSTTIDREISAETDECEKYHPLAPPSLPFVVAEKVLPRPRLAVRSGVSRDNKKAVILRMESTVDSSKCQGFLQYRIFSHFQNTSEDPKDRKWKQLTCIKVKCGKICECTLTQLVPNARYHFSVCLVNGNNRSRFSNCATTKF